MKQLLVLILSMSFFVSFAQRDNQNLKNGVIAKDYDVVSYFNNKAEKGLKTYSYTYNNATYKFTNEDHLKTFKQNPEKYMPQYGGYCAYAIALKGEKVDINPDAFEVRDGKLYLFYKTVFANTLKAWKKENPNKLVNDANKNWAKIIE